MMPAQLKDTTMSPATRTLIRVTVAEDEGETAELVERLMGKRPELRFQYIQENRPLKKGGRVGMGSMIYCLGRLSRSGYARIGSSLG